MKTNFLKRAMRLSFLALLGLMTFVSSCKDEDPAPVVTPTEDGVYIKGAGTALTDFDVKGLMKVTKNEVLQEDRNQLLELYVAVKAGAEGFNLVVVTGGVPKVYGPGADFAVVAEADRDAEEPKVDFWRGTYTESATAFTVPADGLYHIVIDTELKKIAVLPVVWGLIGGASPGGWGANTPMPATFNLTKMDFVATDVVMLVNEFKFRYNDGWKVIIDPTYDLGGGKVGIKANCNLGGALGALEAGGGNIANAEYAKYTFTLTWELGKDFVVTQVKTGPGPVLPTYPDAMYLVGDATAYGWAAPGGDANAIMHKCAGGAPSEGIFWKILYLETGKGFKISAANWADPNLGFTGPTEYDATGVTVSDNGGNMSVAASDMYIVVLNLRDNLTKVSIKPAAVYGIGDAFGGYTEAVAGNLFTINTMAKTLVSPALPAAGNIRMYALHSWIPAWWNAEFNLYTTTIEYRNDGGDQAAVPGTAGKVITLHFDDNTGSISAK